VEEGLHEELIRNEASYYNLWKQQFSMMVETIKS
jgi:ABC-type multidrug transport system fused ATPase/permease subunit